MNNTNEKTLVFQERVGIESLDFRERGILIGMYDYISTLAPQLLDATEKEVALGSGGNFASIFFPGVTDIDFDPVAVVSNAGVFEIGMRPATATHLDDAHGLLVWAEAIPELDGLESVISSFLE